MIRFYVNIHNKKCKCAFLTKYKPSELAGFPHSSNLGGHKSTQFFHVKNLPHLLRKSMLTLVITRNKQMQRSSKLYTLTLFCHLMANKRFFFCIVWINHKCKNFINSDFSSLLVNSRSQKFVDSVCYNSFCITSYFSNNLVTIKK